MGSTEEALVYLARGYYLGFTGYLCKVSETILKIAIQRIKRIIIFGVPFRQDKSDTGVRKLLESGELPLERVLVESDAPFMYPNTRASKLPQHVKSGITERSQLFLHRLVYYLLCNQELNSHTTFAFMFLFSFM